MSTDQIVVSVTEEAIEAILGIRAQEPDAADLALSLAVTGVRGVDFAYELTFIPIVDAGEADSLTHHGALPVVVAGGSIENLSGATIEVRNGGLAIDNPNSPLPKFEMGDATLEGDLAAMVQALLDQQINPAIAAHGGFAELAGVDGDTVFLRLGGGCVGCGLAQVTLSQGIEVAIKNAIPEITNVVDVTNHASGTDPYYQSAKK
jgi:Fe/S biogenesis protein NfuA